MNAATQRCAAFTAQKYGAKKRGIGWEFTFDEWRAWWLEGDRWRFRGHGRYGLCMARYGDVGPYSPGNVYCATNSQNSADITEESKKRRSKTLWSTRRKNGNDKGLLVDGGKRKSRAVVTPDGEFPSLQHAADALGVPSNTALHRCRRQVKGWRFKDDPVDPAPPTRRHSGSDHHSSRAVATPKGVFPSVSQAAKAFGARPSVAWKWANFRRHGWRFLADEDGSSMVEFTIVLSMTLTVFAAGGHVLGPPLFAVFERMIAETIAARDVLLELEAALSCTAS